MRCPNCFIEQPEKATDCQVCRINFEEWRSRPAAPAPAAPTEQPAAPARKPAPPAPKSAAAVSQAPSSSPVGNLVMAAALALSSPLIYKFVVKAIAERYLIYQLETNKTENPDQASDAAGKIMFFSIPDGTEGLFSSHGSLLGMKARIAAVGNRKNGVMLLLMGISQLERTGPADAVESFKTGLAGRLRIDKSETKNIQVAGQAVDVTIDRGALPISAKASPNGKALEVPMVSYLTKVDCEKEVIVALSMGLGENGEDTASSVFRSLGCRSN